MRLCDLCKKGKAIRHIQKHAEPRNLRVFNKVHINIIIITPQGIGKKKYTTIFIEKATSVQWAYFYKSKNGIYNALVKYQKIIKT